MSILKISLLIIVLFVSQFLTGNVDNNYRNSILLNDGDQKDSDGLFAEFNTTKGKIVVRLDYKKTPMTVANFVGLTEGTIKNASFPPGVSFYKGSIWHRVVKGHVIQGGSPVVDKAPEKEEVGSTGYVFPNEITDLGHNKAGMLGMANSGPHTNTCQYTITLGDRSYLNGDYTIFGEVVEGLDVVFNIVQGDTTRSITIIRKGEEAKKYIVNDLTFKKMVDNQWENVRREETLRKVNDEKFIKDNYPGLTSTSSGLRYKVLVPGGGEAQGSGVAANVMYSGRLIKGTSFVSTADAGKPTVNIEPSVFECKLGSRQPTKGFVEGISDMRPGEKRLLIIPPDLGYGSSGFYDKEIPGQKRFVISPGEILIIEVTLISRK